MIDVGEKTISAPEAQEDTTSGSPLKEQLDDLFVELAKATARIKLHGEQHDRLAALIEATQACMQFVRSLAPFHAHELDLPLQVLMKDLIDVGRGLTPEDFVPLKVKPSADDDGRKVTGNRNTWRSEDLRFHCAAAMQIYMDYGMKQADAAERVYSRLREIPKLSTKRIIDWRDSFNSRMSPSEHHSIMYHNVVNNLRRRCGGEFPNVQALDRILGMLVPEFKTVKLKASKEPKGG